MSPARRDEALDWDYKGTSGVCLLTVASQVITHSRHCLFLDIQQECRRTKHPRAGSYR
eukprot:jgi/Botrbrau1/11760/Bobra.0195s0085.1